MAEDLNDGLEGRIADALVALDRDAERRAAQVDPARVAAAVLQRLRNEPVRVLHPRRPSLVALRVAAVVAVLVISGGVMQRLLRQPSASSASLALPVVLPESPLADGSVPQEALLDAVSVAHAASHGALPAATVTIDDLNEQELQALLAHVDDLGGSE